MRYTTTAGELIEVADMCAHCQLDTGGNHQIHCPLHWDGTVEVISTVKVKIHHRETFNETLKRIIKKHRKTLDRLSELPAKGDNDEE